jgi:hypothetical protein
MPEFELPADLSGLPDSELSGLLDQANQAFDATAAQPPTAATAAEATRLADAIEALRGQQTSRAEAAGNVADAVARIAATRQPAATTPPEPVNPNPEPTTEPADSREPELVTASSGGAVTAPRDLGGLSGPRRSLNPSLSEIRRQQPVQDMPARNDPVLVASADIPGFTQGGQIHDMDALVAAMHARARTLPVSHGNGQRVPVAQLQRTYTHNLNLDSTAAEIDRVLTAAASPEVLIAAGGWCAPSEISYDFFNIACIDGLLDLPTIGINRGGLRWPTSASFGDINALTGIVWTWNETMDVAAATGTGMSGTKPCVRVPCPAYNEARLSCDGVCVTVGNLTNDAFPELIANHLRLVEAIQAHYTNTRIINSVVAQSTAVTDGGSATQSTTAGILNAANLQATDYREKYAMCRTDVMEAVFPSWMLNNVREDLAKRMGVENFMAVTNAQIAAWFDVRDIRTQWIADWQVRTTGLGQSAAATAWPTSAQFLTYAPGTFVRGNGLTLDLGVVRDSTLNATNDFTAAWMEECYLVAKRGHESRVVTVDVCANGTTGAANIASCVGGTS